MRGEELEDSVQGPQRGSVGDTRDRSNPSASDPPRLRIERNAEPVLADHLQQPVVRERVQGAGADVAVPALERMAAEHARAADDLHRLRDDVERGMGGEVLRRRDRRQQPVAEVGAVRQSAAVW